MEYVGRQARARGRVVAAVGVWVCTALGAMAQSTGSGVPEGIGGDDILTVITASGDLGMFGELLRRSGLGSVLESDGPWTVFAPTDQAFAKLGREMGEGLLKEENRAALRALVTYHIVRARMGTEELSAVATLATLNSQHLDVEQFPAGLTIDRAARVVGSELEARNGVIHRIDTVLLPTTAGVMGVLGNDERFGVMAKLLRRAGLDDELGHEGSRWTVFAPTDDAFDAVSADLGEVLALRANRDVLRRILRGLIVDESLAIQEAMEHGRVATIDGGVMVVEGGGEGVTANGVAVGRANIDAANGMIHALESVSIPADAVLEVRRRLMLGVVSESVSSDAREVLGVAGARRVTGVSGNAKRAGLREGDIILSVDGRPGTNDSINRAKRERGYLGRVEMTVFRDGETLQLTIPVGVDR